MQLSFDNLDELNEIISAMGFVKREMIATITCGELSVTGPVERVLVDLPPGGGGGGASEVAAGGAAQPGAGATDLAVAPVATAAPAVRKRRTKAEIEAAKAAEQAPEPATPAAPDPANPFSQPSTNTQAVLDAPDQRSAIAAGIAATATALPEDVAPDEWIRSRAAALYDEGVDAHKHLELARGFIGDLKMVTYNETFVLSGLSPNVMGYTDADRALHAATMEYVRAHPTAA